jgi:hypothetical protein
MMYAIEETDNNKLKSLESEKLMSWKYFCYICCMLGRGSRICSCDGEVCILKLITRTPVFH